MQITFWMIIYKNNLSELNYPPEVLKLNPHNAQPTGPWGII